MQKRLLKKLWPVCRQRFNCKHIHHSACRAWRNFRVLFYQRGRFLIRDLEVLVSQVMLIYREKYCHLRGVASKKKGGMQSAKTAPYFELNNMAERNITFFVTNENGIVQVATGQFVSSAGWCQENRNQFCSRPT